MYIPWMRYPRTTQERRVNGKSNILEIDEYRIKIRAKRNFRNLPNSYDDLWIYYGKSWKKKRRTQYKVKELIGMDVTLRELIGILKTRIEDLSSVGGMLFNNNGEVYSKDYVCSIWKHRKSEIDKVWEEILEQARFLEAENESI